MRGSDPDAALYWFARMLEGGEDPRFLARRLTRMAVEDIGLADPQAQAVCLDGWQTYERLGSPEGELALAQAVVYLALAPKSNAAYVAYKAARDAARRTGSEPPPKHILNAPTRMMKEQGYGAGYEYDHDAEDAFSGQHYFPDGMKRQVFFAPVERGFERELKTPRRLLRQAPRQALRLTRPSRGPRNAHVSRGSPGCSRRRDRRLAPVSRGRSGSCGCWDTRRSPWRSSP